MPHRLTSRGLAVGGVVLVLLSGVSIVSPVLWGRPNLAKRLQAENAELNRITRSVNDIRDVIDNLRETSGAAHGYLMVGSQRERRAYGDLLQRVETSVQALRAIEHHPALWVRFHLLIDLVLNDLAQSVALEDAGQHAAAMQATDLPKDRQKIAEIDDITHERINELLNRYQSVAQEIRTENGRSVQFASIMFGVAGALFTLGCIALVVYLRRHLAAEALLRVGRDAALEDSGIKTRFISTASHDLRQPLHAISMFVGVLRYRSRDPAILTVVDNIATAVASMQRMFAALLDVARLDAGAVRVERRSLALQSLFDALAVEFAASAAAKGLSLQIQPTSLSVATDPAMLETILRNLLGNATKFTAHGVVGMAAHRQGSMVDILVFDTGIGIAEKDQARIYGQFERLAEAGSSHEGLGLGLSIVQRMVELLGMILTLDSRVGEGSRFTLSLPFAEATPPVASEPAAPMPGLHGSRILVLDEHPGARKAIALAIETLGAVPMEAASPEAAFSLLAAMEPDVPQAAVVDHDLGDGQTGPAFLDRYAAMSDAHLEAVVLTGTTEAATLARLAAAGRPWLIKPVDLEVLRTTLAGLIHPGRVETPRR